MTLALDIHLLVAGVAYSGLAALYYLYIPFVLFLFVLFALFLLTSAMEIYYLGRADYPALVDRTESCVDFVDNAYVDHVD